MQFETLQKDMIAAMKAKDKVRKEAVSSLVSAAKRVAIDEGCRDQITEEIVNRVIVKEMKSVQEQVDTCPDERAELKASYQARLAILKEYAPQMMSPEEVRQVLTEQFSEVLATKNKGQIMKAVMAELKGKADGKVISQVVAELCR